jgi:hypothetical protein
MLDGRVGVSHLEGGFNISSRQIAEDETPTERITCPDAIDNFHLLGLVAEKLALTIGDHRPVIFPYRRICS